MHCWPGAQSAFVTQGRLEEREDVSGPRDNPTDIADDERDDIPALLAREEEEKNNEEELRDDASEDERDSDDAAELDLPDERDED